MVSFETMSFVLVEVPKFSKVEGFWVTIRVGRKGRRKFETVLPAAFREMPAGSPLDSFFAGALHRGQALAFLP
jgi:hypothetical protein